MYLWLQTGRVRGVVVVGHVEDHLAGGDVEHADGVLGAADEDEAVVGERDLGGEGVGGERVELVAGAVVDGEPLVALVAREQEAVGGLGGRGRDQLRDRVRELLQAVFAHDVQAAVARVRQEVGAEQLRCQN